MSAGLDESKPGRALPVGIPINYCFKMSWKRTEQAKGGKTRIKPKVSNSKRKIGPGTWPCHADWSVMKDDTTT